MLAISFSFLSDVNEVIFRSVIYQGFRKRMCFCYRKTLSESETVNVKDGIPNLRSVSKIQNDGNIEMLQEVATIEVQKIC